MDNIAEIKILLVDDREDNLLSMRTVLEKDGYTFKTAGSGQQALKILLHEWDFTLILMDVHMPNLTGFETASMIFDREKLRHIPIIFITANNDSNAFKGYQAGAVDYIYKPINPDLLRAKVAVFVDLYRKNHMLMSQEKRLLKINNELEERVRKRTDELSKKNSELENKNKELSKVNNDLDNFIYTASHDLKAPILNIEGLLTALFTEFDLKDENFQKIKDMTIFSINKLKGTIHDLTEISKIQKEGLDDIETVKFDELLDEVKSNIKESIDKTNAELVVEFNVPEIKFSKKNMRSILYNLVSNAVKYSSPKRKPMIHIKTELLEDNILLTVSDNGLGMKSSYQDKIFGMFKRMHDHVEGSGIGLYIVKRIIENSGGRIEVKSELDAGTTFNVYLKDNVNQPVLN